MCFFFFEAGNNSLTAFEINVAKTTLLAVDQCSNWRVRYRYFFVVIVVFAQNCFESVINAVRDVKKC